MNTINYNLLSSKLFNYLKRRFFISKDLIEDAIQYSYLKLLQYTKPIKNTYNFCVGVAHNYLYDMLKSPKWKNKNNLSSTLECRGPRISNEQCELLNSLNPLDLEFLLDYIERQNLERWAEKFGVKISSLSMRVNRLIKKYKTQYVTL